MPIATLFKHNRATKSHLRQQYLKCLSQPCSYYLVDKDITGAEEHRRCLQQKKATNLKLQHTKQIYQRKIQHTSREFYLGSEKKTEHGNQI